MIDYKELLSLKNFYNMNVHIAEHETIIKKDLWGKVEQLSGAVKNQENINKE